MARVKSYLRLQGSMGESTFLKEGTGPNYRAQDKLVVSPGRFKNDPSFARVRENASEFGRAGKATKLIRTSVSSLLQGMKDKTLGRRLFKAVMEVITSDHTSPRGKGNLVDGNTLLLKDFQFNSVAPISSVFPKTLVTNINRVTVQITINVPEFVPGIDLKGAGAATHFQLQSAAVELDFEQGLFKTDYQQSAQIPYVEVDHPAFTLTHTVTANSTQPLMLAFAIRYFQVSGTTMYPIMIGDKNVTLILDVSKV